MTKKRIKKESKIIAVGFILTAIMIATAVILTIVLSQSLNRFLSIEESLSETEPMKFNFEAYDALGL